MIATLVNWWVGRVSSTDISKPPIAYAAATRQLGVVVPAHAGDLEKALVALSLWPESCSTVTRQRVELILYYAGSGEDDGVWSDEIVPVVEQTGGSCFARTRAVFANLDEKVCLRVVYSSCKSQASIVTYSSERQRGTPTAFVRLLCRVL